MSRQGFTRAAGASTALDCLLSQTKYRLDGDKPWAASDAQLLEMATRVGLDTDKAAHPERLARLPEDMVVPYTVGKAIAGAIHDNTDDGQRRPLATRMALDLIRFTLNGMDGDDKAENGHTGLKVVDHAKVSYGDKRIGMPAHTGRRTHEFDS